MAISRILTDGVANTAIAMSKLDGSSGTLSALTVDNIIINGTNIGHTSDTDAIAISSGGVVTMNQIPVLSAGLNVSGGTIAGTLSTAAQGNITSLGTIAAFRSTGIDDNADALAITIDSSENVGLPTVNANYKLAVVGGAAVGAAGATVAAGETFVVTDASHVAKITVTGGTAQFGTKSAADLVFMRANGEAGRFTATGLGIGTTSPAAKGHIVSDTGELRVENTGTDQWDSGRIRLKGPASDNRSTQIIHGNTGTDSGASTRFAIELANASDAWVSTIAQYDYASRFWAFTTGTGAGSERLRIISDGKVGIGTSTPDSLVEISSSAATTAKISTSSSSSYAEWIFEDGNAGYGFQVRSDNAQSTGTGSFLINDRDSSSFPVVIKEGNATNTLVLSGSKVGIGLTTPLRALHVSGASYEMTLSNTSMSTDRKNMNWFLSGDKAYWRMLNDAGNAGGGNIELDWSGNLKADGYSYGDNGTVQTVINRPNTTASNNSVNAYAEVSTDYRVQITPHHSDSNIHGTFQIPINPSGAANILFFLTPWVSTDGGSTKTVLTGGVNSGSRINNTTSSIRSGNGYDANDMNNYIVHFYYDCAATTQLTFGFYNRSEGTNTVYFNHSATDNGDWGWTAPMYLELKEIRP